MSLPLANVRIVVLALAWALGTISFASNINALVKGDDFVDRSVAAAAKIGTTLYVDTSNVKNPGYVEAAGVGMIALVSFLSLSLLIRDKLSSSSARPLSTTTLPLQAGLLGFFSIWTLGCGIPKTLKIVNGEAKVAAFIGKFPVPDPIVRQTEKLEGFSRVYWDQNYLRFTAIVLWPALFFSIVALIVTLIANSRKSDSSLSYASNRSSGDSSERSSTEKEKTSQV
jgi:hypothetical protein